MLYGLLADERHGRSVPMGTARDAVLQAFAELEQQTGRETFKLSEVCDRVREGSSDFQETTIRTYVTSVMCADAPVHHANHTDDLVRVGRGEYRRATPTDDLEYLRAEADRRVGSSVPSAPTIQRGEPESEWFWEGNIQSAMVKRLAADNWAIVAVANTATREHGVDIIARKSGKRVLVEVKGYPSKYYVRGERKGQIKKTPASLQARVWFADLLMSGMLNTGDEPEAVVVLCMPDVPTYRSLEARTADSLDALGFARVWISENGDVEWA